MAYRVLLDNLLEQNIRSDGREPGELRNITCQLGVFHPKSEGSAYFCIGNTKVLAAVYGPHEISKRNAQTSQEKLLINCEFSTAPFCSGEKRSASKNDRKAIEISTNVKEIIESVVVEDVLGGSQVDIFIELIQDDGSVYAACINATTLALVDAGIPLRDYVVACSATMTHSIPLVDINSQERGFGCSELTVAILPQSEEIVGLNLRNLLQHTYIQKTIQEAVKGCKMIFEMVEESVQRRFLRLNQTLNI